MNLRITRGRIYHTLRAELADLFKIYFSKNNTALIKNFENQFSSFMGVQDAVVFPFARTGLYYILKYKQFPAGSEIIMPPITIKPMVDIVLMNGLKPKFVDIETDTLCFDENELKKNISKKTRAILITYLFGIVPDIDKILSICKEHNLFIIEDFSHNLDAKYKNKKLGTFGDVSIYSSSSMKTVDTYCGGTVFSNDPKLMSALRLYQGELVETPKIFLLQKVLINLMRSVFSIHMVFTYITHPLLSLIHRFNPVLAKKLLGARMNLVPILKMPIEWKYKFTSLQAERGIKQLLQLHKSDKQRIENVYHFKQQIKQIQNTTYPKEIEYAKNVYWQCPVYVKNAESIIKYFDNHRIDIGLTNLSLCSHLDIYPEYRITTINAYKIKYSTIFIPVYTGLSKRQINYIAEIFKEYCSFDDRDKL